MVIVNLHIILNTESCIVAGELLLWGDVRKNGKYNLVWEFEDYKEWLE